MVVRVVVSESVEGADALEVWSVYDEVFADHPDAQSWREAVWDRHAVRAGFRLARAYADDAVLVGFAYGYTGAHGQWWTDRARTVLPASVGERWLGGHFEVVSIGVRDVSRGQGVGRRLLRDLVAGLPHERLLLMTTADGADAARRLYASEGWRVLGPGIGDATVIMGRRGGSTAIA